MSPCCIALFLLIICNVGADFCGNGALIIGRGISDQGKIDVVDEHNRLRLMIAKGQVPKQPRGIDLKKMSYDERLGYGARNVTDTCELIRVPTRDARWYIVGQNIVLFQHSRNSTDQDWKDVVQFWFNENQKYNYWGGLSSDAVDYTQVVWAVTNLVGCDFVHFHNPSNSAMPFSKLYVCNYGPPGNDNDYPYKTGKSGCDNLC